MSDKVKLWFVRRLPNWVIYWSTVHLIAHATSGKYETTVVPELGAMEALRRWGDTK